MAILDSGERTVFETGAVRDVQSDQKGRMDLVPLGIVGSIMCDAILLNIEMYIRTGRKGCLIDAFKEFVGRNYPNMATAVLEVSIHFAEGCKKYGERNWEKGIYLSRYVDSMSRHYMKFLRGDTDESHSRAFMWNLLAALYTHTNMPEMIDLPFADVKKKTSTEELAEQIEKDGERNV